MTVKLSVITPVLNEAAFIGYCVMACLNEVHEFIYLLDENSSDGTRELLQHIKDKYAMEKLVVVDTPNFHPTDTAKYNAAFNKGVELMTGDAAWFLHPDMIVTNPEVIPEMAAEPLAWFTHLTSYAKDMSTIYTKGRCDKWKNIHRNQFGLHYSGAYGGTVEDWYHRGITGNSYRHHQTQFEKYPFEVGDSRIHVNHYCELKPYKRRLEKMTWSLMALNPKGTKRWIEESAANHPRVTLENNITLFGRFEYAPAMDPVPEVFAKYKDEFEAFANPVMKGVSNGR